MAITTIPHNPALTKEQARAVFEKHFAGKYAVEKTSALRRDFQVVKNAFIAVAVRFEQTEHETKFNYSGFTPRWWARLFFVGPLLGYIIWRGLTNEVESFINSAPEFQKAPTPVA